MSTLRLRAAAGEDAGERASGCLVAEAAEMTLRFRAAAAVALLSSSKSRAGEEAVAMMLPLRLRAAAGEDAANVLSFHTFS